MFENWSTIKKLIWLKYTVLANKVKEILYTLSGSSPLSFDQAVDKPMEHLITNIEPVQDLHGYDSPWPAGGGKNLWPNDKAFTYTASRAFTFASPIMKANETYTISGTFDIDDVQYTRLVIFYGPQSGGNTANITVTEGSFVKTFSPTVDVYKINFYATETAATNPGVTASFDFFQIEAGSTATSYVPYSNLCPISGWKTITAWDDAKYGGNIEWNQLESNWNFASSTHWGNASGGDAVYANNECTITFTTNPSAEYTAALIRRQFVMPEGHKTLISLDVYTPHTGQFKYDSNNTLSPNVGIMGSTIQNAWTRVETIATATGRSQGLYMFPMAITNEYSTGDVWKIRNAQIIDLTQMFGSGNEPSTVEEFRTLFPNDYYAYNAGEHTCVGAVNGEPYRKVPVTFGALSANQWDEEWEEGSINNDTGINTPDPNNIRSVNYVRVAGGQDYYMYCGANKNLRWYWYDSEYNFLSSSYGYDMVATAPLNAVYLRIRSTTEYGNTYNHDIAINYPATVTTYNPYTDTIYGGTLDLVTGDGTIDKVYALLNDPDKWITSISGTITYMYNQEFRDRKTSNDSYTGLDCTYVPITSNARFTGRWNGATQYYFGVYDVDGTLTLDQVKTDAAAGKIAICYELADPITFHIDGVSVTPLKGKNNVWTDCGDTLSVTYISSDVSSAVGYAKTDEATAV